MQINLPTYLAIHVPTDWIQKDKDIYSHLLDRLVINRIGSSRLLAVFVSSGDVNSDAANKGVVDVAAVGPSGVDLNISIPTLEMGRLEAVG